MTGTAVAPRVLLVEDEPMVAMMVEDVICDMGFQLVGPAAQLDEALELVAGGKFDCAILDINIRGGNSYAVADLLLVRGCPFVLATGYSDRALPPHLVRQRRLTKPYSIKSLEDELMRLSIRVAVCRGDSSA